MVDPALSRPAALGDGARELIGDLAREGVDGDLDALLDARPRAVVVAAGGEAAFFRASAAMERGCARVILRRGALPLEWVTELAHRASRLGASLFEHDDQSGYRRVTPSGRPARAQVGAAPRALDPWFSARAALDGPLLELDAPLTGVPADLEERAFAAGCKPVLYLVKPREPAAALVARHPGAHAAVRDEAIGVDATTGTRSYGAGEPSAHVFLSASRDEAERAAALWAAGSSAHARELGALLGYPPCCVAAFEALPDRGDNAALIWITHARTLALGGRHASPLDVVVRRVVPFTPCGFGCRAAVSQAERVLAALGHDASTALCRALARPVLYLDEARAVVFDGAALVGGRLRYDAARLVRDDGSAHAAAARRVLGPRLPPHARLRVRGRGVELDGEEVGALLPFG